MDISNYEDDIRKYKALKSSLLNICTNLSSAINSVKDLKVEIKNKYTINDDYSPVYMRSDKLKSNMEITYNNLYNKVIPAIDNAINKINRQIRALEKEEKSGR